MGKKSAIDKLPEALRKKLIDLLNNPAITQVEIADAINESAGVPLISKSSVNRYAIRMKKFAEKNRQAREIADAYIEKYGGTERNKIGQVVNEHIRLAIFDLIGEVEEIKEKGGEDKLKIEALTDVLYKLSRGLRELEQADKLNAERTKEIRAAALADAAVVVEKEAKTAGLDAATLDIIKKKILGI
jgi:hypothetical protein